MTEPNLTRQELFDALERILTLISCLPGANAATRQIDAVRTQLRHTVLLEQDKTPLRAVTY